MRKTSFQVQGQEASLNMESKYIHNIDLQSHKQGGSNTYINKSCITKTKPKTGMKWQTSIKLRCLSYTIHAKDPSSSASETAFESGLSFIVGGLRAMAAGPRIPVVPGFSICFALDFPMPIASDWLLPRSIDPGIPGSLDAWKLPPNGRDIGFFILCIDTGGFMAGIARDPVLGFLPSMALGRGMDPKLGFRPGMRWGSVIDPVLAFLPAISLGRTGATTRVATGFAALTSALEGAVPLALSCCESLLRGAPSAAATAACPTRCGGGKGLAVPFPGMGFLGMEGTRLGLLRRPLIPDFPGIIGRGFPRTLGSDRPARGTAGPSALGVGTPLGRTRLPG
eukprot:m.92678 g.92678  ORF g.92678 m.92678 type:complete len:338 (+) comp12989_c0_seq3:2053-3066(+)